MKYMTGATAGMAAVFTGSVPVAAATPSMLVGEGSFVNLAIPGVAIYMGSFTKETTINGRKRNGT